jgi:phage shock protein A
MQFQLIVVMLITLVFLLYEQHKYGQKRMADALGRKIDRLESDVTRHEGDIKKLVDKTERVDKRAGRLEYQISSISSRSVVRGQE